MKFKIYVSFFSVLFSFVVCSGSTAETSVRDAFTLFSKALNNHVKDGLVDYPAIAKDDNFATYLKWLESADPAKIKSENMKMAFWVNAYNAVAIKNVIENSVPGEHWVKSVLDVEGFFNEQTHKVAGQDLTLDKLEKEVAFPQFNDARLHFAFVCAAMSCPQLPSIAFTGKNIDSLITEVAKEFLNNPDKNRLDKDAEILYLSQIFDWYRADFEKNGQSLVESLLPYFNKGESAFLKENDIEIKFFEYDWKLNLLK